MSAVTSQDDEKYVNGCRLSSSLLELQPFKVVVAEAKSMNEHTPKRQSHNNNNRYKDRRTYSSPGMNNGVVPQDSKDSSKMPLLVDTSNEQSNKKFNSVSCDNIFDSPTLQVKPIPNSEAAQTETPNRSISVEYDPVTRGSSLPKPITRSTSQEKLIANEGPNHVSTEQKKTKPRKPNRESLRRSRPDIRASQPNLPSTNRTSASPNGSPEHNLSSVGGQQVSLMHDYEELPTDVKILQQRQRISQSDAPLVPKVPPTEPGFSPVSFQSQTTPAVPERTKNPRQRLNPLYAGMHMNPYEHQTPNSASTQKRPPTRCLRCLVAGVIVAVLFSILSVAALSLMILGYLEPIKGTEFKITVNQNELISRLQSEIVALKNASDQAQKNIDDQLALTKIEVIDAVKSLNLSALRDPSTADVSQCVHRTFGIGSSSSQSEITSGEYFAEKGYVTTGVTCSASVGYVAYLHTREEDLDYVDQGDDAQQARVFYRCTCHKSPNLALPATRDRVECSIHYWQCPVL